MSSNRNVALAILFVMPLFFSSNIIFGRAVTFDVHPFTLAFLRWTLTALILLPFVWSSIKINLSLIKSQTWPLFIMGFLGMWICGALVYLALRYTSASNGTLIYTSSPVMIILIEWLLRGRKVGWREAIGVILALIGVVVIVLKASWTNLTNLQFNTGDLIFIGAAISWSFYSVALKSKRFEAFQTLPLFCLIALSGALLLAPFALFEVIYFQSFPTTVPVWSNIVGIVLFASLLAFSSFNYGVKVVGASTAGIFMYLLPIHGLTLAVLFLGEILETYHIWGIILVLSGIILATFPARRRVI